MILDSKVNSRKKKINNRRKSRELVMKSVYRGLVNQIDIKQIKKDIQEDPDYIRADQSLYEELMSGVFKNLDLLKKEIESYIDRSYEELSPIELSIIYFSLYELKFSISVPYKVVINEAVEIAKTFGGADGYKYINGILNQAAKVNRASEFKKT
ncbi:MAG: transcription antitermination factor NusB [Nitrosomonadales bacterium]|nr:transcription antitermination factor NusB [Nitrosomonadales bacterium]MBT7120882.1 transcription antitermination factor NusB [Nitrosomonadales bacterium]MBT7407572.1 transcription antitermination factor NusB [Nitrosomonadales bacterium]MBT7482281.1 transcription antitermination factor NusB [Nitrosomonadales bacterium]MBT7689816.1 transcription antitermination factor NusB [Nitrosomonadales bacterium]